MSKPILIVYPTNAAKQELLAAREIRRYVYLRTSRLLPLVSSDVLPAGANGYSIAIEGREQEYRIATVTSPDGKWIHVTGGRDGGILYAAYRVAEHLGIRFALHGDIVPDRQIDLSLPDIDESGVPLFELRGILPFHDFPEGPDWWSEDDYKAVLSQLPKLRMNFFSLHTYPEKQPDPLSYNAEPGIWIGVPDDVREDGVSSSYPARHFTTASEVWGFTPRPTGDYRDGASELFDRDDYGAPYMAGKTPWPADESAENELFDQFGSLLRNAFGYAKEIGIRTCIGTETPLTVPEAVRKRLKAAGMDADDPDTVRKLYEGMFTRIQNVHPLDYYWLWTPEDWTWKGNTVEQSEAVLRDIQSAIVAANNTNAPFAIATCGWVLGPQQDRSQFDRLLPEDVPFSCINRHLGFEFVDTGFQAIERRPTWAIPWMEDDPAMILPQLWAGRMRRDAADAAAYGCNGLMGIHWRTKIIDPNISALAAAGWNQTGWNPEFGVRKHLEEHRPEGSIGGIATSIPAQSDKAAHNDGLTDIHRTVRAGLEGYRLLIPVGTYRVTLNFREWSAAAVGERVFTVSVYSEAQARAISRTIDLYEHAGVNKPYDLILPDVLVTDGTLNLLFRSVKGEACLSGIEITGQTADVNQFKGYAYSRRINCGGEAIEDYEADLLPLNLRDRNMDVTDFYLDWATARFGPEAAALIAEQFVFADGNLPRPVVWGTGPGSTITADRSPWEVVAQNYVFLDRLENLQPYVLGPGNKERFDYWLNQFRFLRCVSQIGCALGAYETAMEPIANEHDESIKQSQAKLKLLPIRKQIVSLVAELNRFLLASVSTPGELGTVANIQQQALHHIINRSGQQLEALLGEPLPQDAQPSMSYSGKPRLIVPTVRTSLNEDEELNLTVLFLGVRPDDAAVYWKPLGGDIYDKVPLKHVNRGVYRATIPATGGDFEYFIKDRSNKLRFPATAEIINQTVVRI
ncbi:malectin domain-containing carbohydrate-binding protein [Cohnella silvisoli]|uniref:Malectin domain-containing carbohydrate-binding protein n=1 Tax=Cohnella silvisoli TaxID=2873699 RepID=A0ABV1KW38_9BACL|nr:malectin domain-containing carbohydrate-binding protein [Cohnella silvisoli]MCD9023721.1 hypothetical protein [Cohnella silvisoli]